jgi:hypothetical protein
MITERFFHIVGSKLVAGIPFFADLDKWDRVNGFLVGIDTAKLDFAGEYAAGFHLFPGGEWHQKRPVWWDGEHIGDQRRRRREARKQEVWLLSPGESLGVADAHNGLRFVKAGEERLDIVAPAPQEVADYLYNRALALAHFGDKGLNWVRCSLKAISNLSEDPRVKAIHRQVSKLKPVNAEV